MFEFISPESAGVSSGSVKDYLDYLNRRGLAMHGVLMMKGDKLFTECHWAPFDKDFCHRMYSQTKSYVAIAIGLLRDEGKLKLTDKIADHFPEKIHSQLHEYLKEQTIEDMLLMCTAGGSPHWFDTTAPDRTELYFGEHEHSHPSSTVWLYDSPGSQVLCNLVEKLSGKTMLEYLREKLFNKMGTFKNAQLLKTRNGDSWGDSALICTQRDMASFARLLLNDGCWHGKQLISADYVKTATSPLVCNDETGFYDCHHSHGYGYQIWHTEMDGFGFLGMGGQLTIAIPSLDIIFVCTSDNQGYASAYNLIVDGLFDYVLAKAGAPLPEDPQAKAALDDFCSRQELIAYKGRLASDFYKEINGVTFLAEENTTGITKLRFSLDENKGTLYYTNAQGDKELPFGIGKNEFSLFPELGYSNEFGGMRTTDGFKYKCAASAGWTERKKLCLKVQIIDRYFGNFFATFAFKDDCCVVRMRKTAEDFLQTYQGEFVAKRA